jgi:hypothetical protein
MVELGDPGYLPPLTPVEAGAEAGRRGPTGSWRRGGTGPPPTTLRVRGVVRKDRDPRAQPVGRALILRDECLVWSAGASRGCVATQDQDLNKGVPAPFVCGRGLVLGPHPNCFLFVYVDATRMCEVT